MTLLFNNYEKLLGKKETFWLSTELRTFAVQSRPHDGLSESKGFLNVICFWSSWSPKKKGLSLKTFSLLNLYSSSLSSSIEDLHL